MREMGRGFVYNELDRGFIDELHRIASGGEIIAEETA